LPVAVTRAAPSLAAVVGGGNYEPQSTIMSLAYQQHSVQRCTLSVDQLDRSCRQHYYHHLPQQQQQQHAGATLVADLDVKQHNVE